MTTATDKEQARRATIIAAARALLVERGFQDIALDDIARKAGVAKGTLFLYYKSKEELFAAAFSDLVERLGEVLAAVKASPLRGRALLDEAARAILEHFDRNKDFMAQFGAGRFPGCGDRSCGKLMAKMNANLELLAGVMGRCADDRLIKGGDLEAHAAFMFGLCRSAILYNHIKKVDKPLVARRAQVVDMFLNGAGR